MGPVPPSGRRPARRRARPTSPGTSAQAGGWAAAGHPGRRRRRRPPRARPARRPGRHLAGPDRSRARDRRGRRSRSTTASRATRCTPAARGSASRAPTPCAPRSATPACCVRHARRSAPPRASPAWRARSRRAGPRASRSATSTCGPTTRRRHAIADALARADVVKVNDREVAQLGQLVRLGRSGRRRCAARHGRRDRGRHPRRRRLDDLSGDGAPIAIAGVHAAPGGDNVGCGDAYLAILVHGMTSGWDLATSRRGREPVGRRGRRACAARRRCSTTIGSPSCWSGVTDDDPAGAERATPTPIGPGAAGSASWRARAAAAWPDHQPRRRACARRGLRPPTAEPPICGTARRWLIAGALPRSLLTLGMVIIYRHMFAASSPATT